MTKPRRRGGVYPQKVRCKATNRWGEQCRKWAMKGSVVCNKHGGAAPQVRRKAQERIMMAQDDAASMLVKALADDRIPFPERRRVAEFLLTYENRNQVQLTVAKWEQDIAGLLVDVEDTGDDTPTLSRAQEPRALSGQPAARALPSAPEPVYDVTTLPSLADDPPRHSRGPRLR